MMLIDRLITQPIKQITVFQDSLISSDLIRKWICRNWKSWDCRRDTLKLKFTLIDLKVLLGCVLMYLKVVYH